MAILYQESNLIEFNLKGNMTSEVEGSTLLSKRSDMPSKPIIDLQNINTKLLLSVQYHMYTLLS